MAAGYEVFLRDGALYAFKGIAGRFAPIAVHVSLVAILGGAAFGALAGFDGQIMLPEGQEVLVANTLRGAGTALPGVPLPEGAKRVLRLDRFTIDYRPDGSVGQFRSLLTERDLDGRELRQKEIYVNEPLRFGGVTLYQVRARLQENNANACGNPADPAFSSSRSRCGLRCRATVQMWRAWQGCGFCTRLYEGSAFHQAHAACRRTGRCRASASASVASRTA